MIQEICYVKFGNHIGEYLNYKLEDQGRQKTWLARKLNTSKQNLNSKWLAKSELSPSEFEQLEEILGTNFFDEFFESNPELKIPYYRFKPAGPIASGSSDFQEPAMVNSGYRISIEIDPVNFNPIHAEQLGSSLRKALEDFKEAIKEDNL